MISSAWQKCFCAKRHNNELTTTILLFLSLRSEFHIFWCNLYYAFSGEKTSKSDFYTFQAHQRSHIKHVELQNFLQIQKHDLGLQTKKLLCKNSQQGARNTHLNASPRNFVCFKGVSCYFYCFFLQNMSKIGILSHIKPINSINRLTYVFKKLLLHRIWISSIKQKKNHAKIHIEYLSAKFLLFFFPKNCVYIAQ